jgi:hypothetical protein
MAGDDPECPWRPCRTRRLSACADTFDGVREETAQWMYDLLTSIDTGEKTLKRQRKRTAPIKIATFEC